jgi:phosphoribosylglycinamide formyltransferase 1
LTSKIAIFASGSGTNAEQIIRYFRESDYAEVALVLSNAPGAYVLERARQHGIDHLVFGREEFYRGDTVDRVLEEKGIGFIVLAGFLWLMPPRIIARYPTVNIHPALLPKYGGKGMYGMRVHEAVVASGDRETGISIHRVNEHYDEGELIFQARCPVNAGDSPEDVAARVHQLEYAHFPRVIGEEIRRLREAIAGPPGAPRP